jgi:HAD superfamily hydrolase (TIGR01509 family)
MIEAVIFDFNGVLVDDEEVHFELFREILAQEGLVITEQDYYEQYMGYDDRGCFAAALSDAGQSFDDRRLDKLIKRKAERYVEIAEKDLRYFPHASETLTAIAARWPVAICSGALRSEIEYALKRLHIRDQITAIIAAEDAHKCKPDPAGYLQALDALRSHLRDQAASGVKLVARACLVVEDTVAGIAAAKAAGMWAVGITHSYHSSQLRQSGADAVIHRLETLTPDWIDRQFASNPNLGAWRDRTSPSTGH